MNIKIMSACCLFLAGGLCLFAAEQANSPTPGPKHPWPKDRTEAQPAVDAFTATLTQSGYDKTFRDSLKVSPESARDVVSKTGNIDIPKDILIIFHEPEVCKNYYPFYLPKLGEKVTDYIDYFQGCFTKFRLGLLSDKATPPPKTGPKNKWNPDNIAAAFTAVLDRSTRDQPFRELLTGKPAERGTAAALKSAKEAVSDEGWIDIPTEVVILFHDDRANEKYHMFFLPPFDKHAPTYEYRAHFEGFYFVW